MALETFLRVDGVTGGSRNYYHPGWADVVSWQWHLSGAGAAMPPDELRVVKRVGMESPALMKLWAQGGVVAAAEINIVPVVGKRDAQQKYLSMAFEDLSVKSIATGGKSEESVFSESITLVFARVKFEFHQYADAGPDGGAQALQSFGFGWDTAANKPWA